MPSALAYLLSLIVFEGVRKNTRSRERHFQRLIPVSDAVQECALGFIHSISEFSHSRLRGSRISCVILSWAARDTKLALARAAFSGALSDPVRCKYLSQNFLARTLGDFLRSYFILCFDVHAKTCVH